MKLNKLILTTTVSKMLSPLVMTSSITITLSPQEYSPSINFFVPYVFCSFRRISIGKLVSKDTPVAIGKAV